MTWWMLRLCTSQEASDCFSSQLSKGESIRNQEPRTTDPGPGTREQNQEPGTREQSPETRGQGQRSRAGGPQSSSSCHGHKQFQFFLCDSLKKKTSASFHQLSVPQCVRWRGGEAELCSVTQNISSVADEISFASLRK